jgi:hypothetical protein
MSLNWGPIAQMAATPFGIALIGSKLGMQRSLRTGVAMSSISVGLRLLAALLPASQRSTTGVQWLLQLAGMACGAAAPFTQGSPSRFSALWYPPESRTRATALCFLGVPLGLSIGYAVAPLLVPSNNDLLSLLWFHAAFGVPPILGVLLRCPDAPQASVAWWLNAPRPAAAGVAAGSWREAARAVLRQLLTVVRVPSFWLLALICSLNGPYQAHSIALHAA